VGNPFALVEQVPRINAYAAVRLDNFNFWQNLHCEIDATLHQTALTITNINMQIVWAKNLKPMQLTMQRMMPCKITSP
jgi:hypothetical protein